MKIFNFILSFIFLFFSVFIFVWTLDVSNLINLDFDWINDTKFIQDFIKYRNLSIFWFYSFLSSIMCTTLIISFGLIGQSIKKKKISGFKIVWWITFLLLLAIIIISSIFMFI